MEFLLIDPMFYFYSVNKTIALKNNPKGIQRHNHSKTCWQG